MSESRRASLMAWGPLLIFGLLAILNVWLVYDLSQDPTTTAVAVAGALTSMLVGVQWMKHSYANSEGHDE